MEYLKSELTKLELKNFTPPQVEIPEIKTKTNALGNFDSASEEIWKNTINLNIFLLMI